MRKKSQIVGVGLVEIDGGGGVGVVFVDQQFYFAVGFEELFCLFDDLSDVEGADAFLGGDQSGAVAFSGFAALAEGGLAERFAFEFAKLQSLFLKYLFHLYGFLFKALRFLGVEMRFLAVAGEAEFELIDF